jgi:hypothetical protein
MNAALPGAPKKRPQYSRTGAFLHEEPGSDLLWHGLQPHYHRRRAFSLPSSEWDRVVPARYGRQANRKTLCLTLVAFADALDQCPEESASMHLPLGYKRLEVIWSSLTGN